jgi:hypothetical protein
MTRLCTLMLIAFTLVGLAALGWNSAGAAPPAQGALALITAPGDNAIVRGTVSIQGSAMHPQFQFYKVEYAPEPARDDNYAIIGAIYEGQVMDGQLAVWDTTLVPDGSYTLRLRVLRIDGNYDEDFVSRVVVANTQPTETPTPAGSPTPMATPTPLPPTPTILVEAPGVPTQSPTLPPSQITPLPTPEEEQEFGVSMDIAPLQTACLFGAGGGLGVFLLFGFLAALRNLLYALLGGK